MSKIIIIDTDVVSHFIAADEILSLTKIFPQPIKMLDKVFDELARYPKKQQLVQNLINWKYLEVIPFPIGEITIYREYLYIKNKLFKGDGESACMAVARFQENILASSNLKDIGQYCKLHSIDYLTTMDFLCYALKTGFFDETRCDNFITAVLNQGSKLPVKSMKEYVCRELDFV
jgi:hypothetical protein